MRVRVNIFRSSTSAPVLGGNDHPKLVPVVAARLNKLSDVYRIGIDVLPSTVDHRRTNHRRQSRRWWCSGLLSGEWVGRKQ